MILEETVALFTLPANPGSGFSPCAPKRLELPVDLCFAVCLGVAGVSGGPFGELCGLAGARCASGMVAVLTDDCLGGNKDGGALVAGAPDALLGRLVDEFVSSAGADAEHALSLWLVGGVLFGLLLLGRLLLGKARALLAAPVLALDTGPVGAIEGAAAVAGAVDTHANGLLDTLQRRHGARCGNPLMRLEGEAILCKESAGTLLLHGVAVQGLCGGGGAVGWLVVLVHKPIGRLTWRGWWSRLCLHCRRTDSLAVAVGEVAMRARVAAPAVVAEVVVVVVAGVQQQQQKKKERPGLGQAVATWRRGPS